jgi:hypothetical protein
MEGKALITQPKGLRCGDRRVRAGVAVLLGSAAALVLVVLVCAVDHQVASGTSLLQGFRTSSVGWQGWGPELVVSGHIAPANEIGRWTTIPQPWDKSLHETRPVFRDEFHDLHAQDGWSGQSDMGEWFANHTVEENEDMFPGLMSDVGSEWGPELMASPAFDLHYHQLRFAAMCSARLCACFTCYATKSDTYSSANHV